LKSKVADHVRKKHKVDQTTDTIWNFAKQKIRQT
jgi:predicted small metal-binding protein